MALEAALPRNECQLLEAPQLSSHCYIFGMFSSILLTQLYLSSVI